MVDDGRPNLTHDQVAALADGRIYSGGEALANGLVDEIGGEREARAWLASERGVSADLPRHDVKIERNRSWLLSLLDESGKSVLPEPLTLDGMLALWQPSDRWAEHGRPRPLASTRMWSRTCRGRCSMTEVGADRSPFGALSASLPARRRAHRQHRCSTRSPWRWRAAIGSNCAASARSRCARRNARVGRNPRTGATVKVDEKNLPFFKTGKELRERLNDGGSD